LGELITDFEITLKEFSTRYSRMWGAMSGQKNFTTGLRQIWSWS